MASRPKISVKSRRNVFVRKIEISDTLKSDATVPPPFLHCSMVSLSARLCWNVTPEGLPYSTPKKATSKNEKDR